MKPEFNIDFISIHFQHLQNCSISCWGYGDSTFAFFIEMRPNNSKSWHCTKLWLSNCVEAFRQTVWLLIAPILALLFIDIPREVKMGLNSCNQSVKNNSIRIQDTPEPPIEHHSGILIHFKMSLWNLDFIWVKTEVIKQNVLQISVQDVQSNTLISGIASTTLDQNFPNFFNSLSFAD